MQGSADATRYVCPVSRSCIRNLSQEKLLKLRKAQILRSLAAKSDFSRAANDVVRTQAGLGHCTYVCSLGLWRRQDGEI